MSNEQEQKTWLHELKSDERFALMTILTAIIYSGSDEAKEHSFFGALQVAEELYQLCLGAYSYSYSLTEEAKRMHEIVNSCLEKETEYGTE